MANFTKGKWNVATGECHITFSARTGDEWLYSRGIFHHIVRSEATNIALILTDNPEDARLMAAAPEMLALLKVWTTIGAQPTLREAQGQARKLIARLEGED